MEKPAGLSKEEAARRLREFGPNEIVGRKKAGALFEFLSRFKNPLVGILVGAALVSGFFGDRVSASLIIAIVIISTALDFINTYRSEQAAEELKKKVMITATVLRGGTETEIPLREIVPGDLVLLHPGDFVPADGTVQKSGDFFLNEAALTGESFPVEKAPGTETLMGTSVLTGEGLMEVTATGRNTRFSKVAEAIAARADATEFDRGIRDFSSLIMKITFTLVILIFLVNATLKHSVLESFLFAAALAVGLTPELLPMIIALNLAKGSLKMSRHGVIVKKLSAIQDFGSMDVLCTDKTGTLTEDRIELVQYVDGLGRESEDVLRYAYAQSSFVSGFKNPLDDAIRDFKKIDISGFKKIDEIPFDYERRRDSVAVEESGKRILITKGAPEEVLRASISFKDKPLDAATLTAINAEYKKLSEEGFRVLGIATKELRDTKETYARSDESAMTFLGFTAFLDPPKKTVAETVKTLEAHHIEIKILTGDNEVVSQKIARDIGLPLKGTLTGADIEHLSDDALRAKTGVTTIFARVNPEQKERVIRALKTAGHVVGYMGDGVNDAPPLKAADVGISVNNAVDLAKDTASVILMKKSLKDLVEGVIEGRKTFANTMKYLMMALSSNFGNMFSMAGASLLFPFLPMLPTQILFNNLLYDTSQFTIPTDAVDRHYVEAPKKFDIRFLSKFMLVFGTLSSLFDFLTFFVLSHGFGFSGAAFQTGWFLESIATQAFVVYVIRTRRPPSLKNRPSTPLVVSTLGAVVLGFIVTVMPFGRVLQFIPLHATPLFAIAVITATYLFVIELAKKRFYLKFGSGA